MAKGKFFISNQLLALLLDSKKRFFLLLFLTPLFWLFLFNIENVAQEWTKAPIYFEQKYNTLFSEDRLRPLLELRWEAGKANSFLSLVFFNKGLVFFDEGFSYLTFLSPRLYFQSGDGTQISPPGVEPIAVLLFPFWLFGFFIII